MSESESEPSLAPIAAIIYTPSDHVEPILVEAARRLSALGIKLGGVLQHDLPAALDDPCAMELENLTDGSRFAMSQALGRGSVACRLDTASLAHAGVCVRAAIDHGAELIMINKFGGQEALGAGLRDEMALAVSADVPLLTAVGKRFLPEWREFTGGEFVALEPDTNAILAWWQGLDQQGKR